MPPASCAEVGVQHSVKTLPKKKKFFFNLQLVLTVPVTPHTPTGQTASFHGQNESAFLCPRLRYSLPARGQQQPAAMGHVWRQEAVWPEASQPHRGGPGQPAQRVATETALPVARSPALLHRVPRHQHELQPALQPHRPLRPGPGRTLGVLPASQEGTDGHITARWTRTHTHFALGFAFQVI